MHCTARQTKAAKTPQPVPPAQRIEQHGKHQREQQRQATQKKMRRNVDVAEPEPADGQETEQDQCGVEHKRKRQGEAPSSVKSRKYAASHRRRAEQQRHALARDERGKNVVGKAHKHDESKA